MADYVKSPSYSFYETVLCKFKVSQVDLEMVKIYHVGGWVLVGLGCGSIKLSLFIPFKEKGQ